MMSEAARRFAALPTAAKLLLVLTAALLPIGLGLMWIANEGIRDANAILRERSEEQSWAAARAIERLVARNALALRIAANGALADTGGDACGRARRSLTIAPAVARRFALQDSEGRVLCGVDFQAPVELPSIAPGDIRLRVGEDGNSIVIQVGVVGGMATASLPVEEIRAAATEQGDHLASLVINDGERQLPVISPDEPAGRDLTRSIREWPIANGQLVARTGSPVQVITRGERLILVLPVLMWIIAGLIGWIVVTRFLIRPLRRLQRAVIRFEPGDSEAVLPRRLGPATEIQELRDSFARAVSRVEESERDMAAALEGQRKLVREVHHRVKNNLQVIASLLNIHSRTAESPHARDAYSAIGRRVGALSIVHRNHFAEMEEQRGISLRPLLSELAAELRAGAPDAARSLRIDLEMEGANTTQDAAVSVAFLVTEIVEYAMLHRPDEPVEISLRRTSDLTARLTLSSPVLVPDESDDREKVQFERIIAGLAKQLRSELDRKLGRYSVELPVFPLD
jgi:two-component sensor histidine kinase